MYLCAVHALKGDHCVAASRYSACSPRMANRVNIPPSLMFFFQGGVLNPDGEGRYPTLGLERSYFTIKFFFFSPWNLHDIYLSDILNSYMNIYVIH